MGLIKQAKQNMVAAEAKRAIEEGRKVFVAKLIRLSQADPSVDR